MAGSRGSSTTACPRSVARRERRSRRRGNPLSAILREAEHYHPGEGHVRGASLAA